VKGIGPTRAASVVASWQEHRNVGELMMFLQGHGITTGLAIKIYKAYGADAVQVVQQNPYRLTEIAGVGFKKADQVAQAMGFVPDTPERVRAGLLYTLREQSARAGHVFTPQPELVTKAAALLGVASALVEGAIRFLQNEGKVVVDSSDVYLTPHFEAETSVAGRIRLLAATASPIRDRITKEVLARAARGLSITLSPEQRRAVETTLTHKVTVLTGGPGTGKTTVTRAIIQALEAVECPYTLCAPTGRAAKRLAEATGREALTIHRLLEYNPGEEERFGRDEMNPLPVGFLIADECSMLDLQLADRLLRAVDLPAHVLLVGDVDQLPSVGAGNVLRDVIESGRVAVVRLDAIFRQAAGSGIVANAHRINQGAFPICNDGFRDFFLFVQRDPQEAVERVVDLVSHRIPAKFGLRPGNIQVLAPMYKGDCGIDALNARLQETLNPAAPRKAERKLANRVFREGDRVMQIRNCYDKDVFNGDVGVLQAIDAERKEMVVIVDGRRVTYEWNEADELVHAYAISIHKAQGSEYSAVVVPVLTQHHIMLRRNLLYTAITRAEQLVVLVGTKQAIGIAVRNDAVRKRYSRLAERLCR